MNKLYFLSKFKYNSINRKYEFDYFSIDSIEKILTFKLKNNIESNLFICKNENNEYFVISVPTFFINAQDYYNKKQLIFNKNTNIGNFIVDIYENITNDFKFLPKITSLISSRVICSNSFALKTTDFSTKEFKTFSITYKFWGKDLDENKINKAVKLSEEKYCGVSETLKQGAELDYNIEINEK